MNLRHLLSAAFMALAVASTTYCSGGGPTTPPDPPPPTPDLVVGFPGMTMQGDTLFMTEGDSISCVGTLIPPSTTLDVGWLFNGAPGFCEAFPGHPAYQKLFYVASGSVITPQRGSYPLKAVAQSGSGTVVKERLFTVVVVPRPEGQLAMIGLLPRNRDETYP